MVKFINALTGSSMFVDEKRVDEYIARGHKLAPCETPPTPPKAEPKKSTSTKKKKTTAPKGVE